MRKNSIKKQAGTISPSKARVIARLIADGAVYKAGTNYTMKYECKDAHLLKSFANDFEAVHGLRPKLGMNASGKTGEPIAYYRVRSVDAYADLVSYTSYYSADWRVPDGVVCAPKSVRAAFLQAFFDDEGTVLPKAKMLRIYSINRVGLEGVGRMLQDFGIAYRLTPGFGLKRNVYAIEVVGQEQMRKFYGAIGSMCDKKKEGMEHVLAKGHGEAI